MTREETKLLLTILADSYPATYRDMSREQKLRQIELYQGFYGGYDSALVVAALKNYIRSNQYPPTVAGLQEQIDLLAPESDTDAELWTQIQKACGNAMYHAEEEYARLPKVCQRWLGGPSGLRDLGMVRTEILSTVTRGEFLKSVKAIRDRERAINSLPEEVRKALEGGRKQIGGSHESRVI